MQKLVKGEILMVNIGSTSTGSRIQAVRADLAKVALTVSSSTSLTLKQHAGRLRGCVRHLPRPVCRSKSSGLRACRSLRPDPEARPVKRSSNPVQTSAARIAESSRPREAPKLAIRRRAPPAGASYISVKTRRRAPHRNHGGHDQHVLRHLRGEFK